MIIGNVVSYDDKYYKNKIDAYIYENQLQNDIYTPGYRSDIADILATTDCVLIPSIEGLSLVAMEAMAAKTRVVSIEKGGGSELLKKAGLSTTYPIDASVKIIADTILKTIQQESSYIENAFEFSKKQDSISYAKTVECIFNRVCKND